MEIWPLLAVATQSGEVAVPVLRNPTIEEPSGKSKAVVGMPVTTSNNGVVAELLPGSVVVPRSATYTK
jgi:hypothetical protein